MILVYVNSSSGLSKSAYETVTYGKKLGEVIVITNGNAAVETLNALGEYGASKVLIDRNVSGEDSQQLTKLVAWAAQENGVHTVIFSHDLIGKAVAPRLSVRWNAGLVSGAIALPDADG